MEVSPTNTPSSRGRYAFASIDETQPLLNECLTGYDIQHIGSHGDFSFEVDRVRIGGVSISDMSVSEDVAVQVRGLRSGYKFLLPLSGSLRVNHRDRSAILDAGTSLILGPGEALEVEQWTRRSRVFSVGFRGDVLQNAVGSILGLEAVPPLEFQSPIAVTEILWRWTQMVQATGDFERLLLSASGPVGAMDGVIRGFLAATDHKYPAVADDPSRTVVPKTVRKAIQKIEEDLAYPLAVSSLAAHCGVDARTLQTAFRKHLGTTPMAYLREARLRRIHAALQAANEFETTVSSVASQFGISHLGRFSVEYRKLFGVSPSETLRMRG
ncbi:AraC family transcriptional regulator [Actinoplanes sp. NPDC049265]|uniref:AraC family transcriptional regulator n=1 Tax=Actinoplanes sp. NPDC049265 TaxID=3363902 RepID=UPI0037126270